MSERSSAERRRRGMLIVLSAPSGAGKSSLARRLVAADRDLEFSVSHTTRPMRAGERDGREYHFVSDRRFEEMARAGEFLEWAEVFGARYGTGRQNTERVLAGGRDLLLDIDVRGACQVREALSEAVLIFVMPPDFPTLEQRLRERRSEADGAVRARLAEARREVEEYRRYDYVVVNDDLDQTVRELEAIVAAERLATSRSAARVERILRSFPPSP